MLNSRMKRGKSLQAKRLRVFKRPQSSFEFLKHHWNQGNLTSEELHCMSRGQKELFPTTQANAEHVNLAELFLSADFLIQWHKRLQAHQKTFFKGKDFSHKQSSLFALDLDSEEGEINQIVNTLNPLSLSPLPISFWRTNNQHHKGPAIYFVTDLPEHLDTPILLYIGETVAAEKRWKGEHDCKRYIAAYSEALSRTSLTAKLSIRFLTDVPRSTKSRRKLERLLIEKWLPPFNKESRSLWGSPFTA